MIGLQYHISTTGVHGDESLQPTLDEASIGNEIVVESSQDERQQEEPHPSNHRSSHSQTLLQ